MNEAEIVSDLATLGFEEVFNEELNVEQQISLFRQAAWIVAPNGSSLLNVIFADPAVKLLVISQPNLFNWGTFQGPMETLGYKPIFVCGEYAVSEEEKHADYRVSIESVRRALVDMGMSEAAA